MTVTFKREDFQSINTFVKSIKDLQEINTTGTLDNVIDTLIKGLGTFVLACDTVGKVGARTSWRHSYTLANPVEDEGQEQEPDTAEDTAELKNIAKEERFLALNYNLKHMPIGYEEGMGVYL